MCGFGSGRRWHYGAKRTTEDSTPLDIRRLQRAGVLNQGQFFGWEWTVGGRAVANIQGRVEVDRVVLFYRHRGGDESWQDVEQPVRFEHTPCTYGGRGAGGSVRPAVGASLSSTVAADSFPVVTAIAWSMQASGKRRTIVRGGRRRR